MKNAKATQYKQRLDSLLGQAEAFGGGAELQSHWAKYLCVLVSAFLENSIRAIYAEYAEDKSISYVANYVESKLQNFQNPKMEKILQLAGAFNPQWREYLNEHSQGEIKDAVDSIVDNRHQIVHGRDVGVTFVRISDYYKNAVKLVNMIDEQCNSKTK